MLTHDSNVVEALNTLTFVGDVSPGLAACGVGEAGKSRVKWLLTKVGAIPVDQVLQALRLLVH